MRMYDLIDKKRSRIELTAEEIEFFVSGVTDGTIPDYQTSALLMAICFVGMTDRETHLLTDAMARSGDMLDLSRFGALSVDKHSTGGVGDKTTLIVAPIVAELGCTVAKLSGRGLGHTGGTLDKLESVRGFSTDLTPERFMQVAEECGLCVCGAGANLAPADKKLYALRDVTATVSSIPLIVSSIMSKKLSGGAGTIVLDVKTGSGSFMKTVEDSETLARGMVEIGRLAGKKTSAVITNMSVPLGRMIGNALEVAEAVALLRGDVGNDENLREICLTLSAEILSRATDVDFESALSSAKNALDSGKAYERFLSWIALQGGDITVFDDISDFTKAEYVTELRSDRSGYIASADASDMGISAMLLGAGRAKKEDVIDPVAGIEILKTVGDYVEIGTPIAVFRSNTVSDHASAHSRWLSALTFSDTQPEKEPLIYKIIR